MKLSTLVFIDHQIHNALGITGSRETINQRNERVKLAAVGCRTKKQAMEQIAYDLNYPVEDFTALKELRSEF